MFRRATKAAGVNMPKLSVIVPSIRPHNLLKLYNSIDVNDFEMIIVSPQSCNLENLMVRIKWIKSFRSPNACQMQGLMEASGDWVTFASDDGVFLPGALDYAFNILKVDYIHNPNKEILEYKKIIVGKYLEGDSPNPDMGKPEYYRFKYHRSYRIKGVPQDCLIFNCGIISRKFLLELGGWDAENFDCTTVAHADLGIRAYKAGAHMIMADVIFKCSHHPGNTGDHKPVNRAMKRDLKRFKQIYSKIDTREVFLDNWEQTSPIWKERFGS